jgi:hypothetical protein
MYYRLAKMIVARPPPEKIKFRIRRHDTSEYCKTVAFV